MFELSTTIELPIAHRLEMAYDSLCTGRVGRDGQPLPATARPVVHGHNYNITVTARACALDNHNMVMDFKRLKQKIHEVLDKYDHSLILKYGDPMLALYEGQAPDSRLFVWDENPTAEAMAHRFFQELETAGLVDLISVTVEETAHNKVCYYE